MSLPAGYQHTAETKAKMSATRTKTLTQDQMNFVDQNHISSSPELMGRKLGIDGRRVRRYVQEQYPEAPRIHAAGADRRREYVRTPEHQEKLAAANRGAKRPPQTAEQREKNRQAQLGNTRAKNIKYTPELRAKRSKNAQSLWLTGVYDKNHKTWGYSGHHNGVHMRCLNSEGVFAQELDDAGIEWQYEPRRFKLSWCSYTPDFYLPEFDLWVEIKGWLKPKQAKKIEAFRRETGKTLCLIYQRELPRLVYKEAQNFPYAK